MAGSISFVTTSTLQDLCPGAFAKEHALDRLPAGTRLKVVVGCQWPTSKVTYELDVLRALAARGLIVQVDAAAEVVAAWALALGSSEAVA